MIHRLLYIAMVISFTAAVIFAVNLVNEIRSIRQSRAYYAGLSANIPTRPRETRVALPSTDYSETAQVGVPQPDEEENTNPPLHIATEQVGEPLEYENLEENNWVPYVDFTALGDQFPGITAWIQLEGTVIDYPIMQWHDNDYFLSHLPDGTNHKSGSIFLDYRNSSDFSDKNTLIYGHASRTDDMFGMLKYYREQAFYEENPIVYIFTPHKDYALVLFAGYLLDSMRETPPLDFSGDDAFLAHIADIKSRSFFQGNVEVGADDKIVSLCTCAYDYDNARLVIVGKLVVL